MICRRCRRGVTAVVRGRIANPLNTLCCHRTRSLAVPDLVQFSRDLLQQLVLGPPAVTSCD